MSQSMYLTIFHIFHYKEKRNNIYDAKFSKSMKFYKNQVQTFKNMGPQTYKERRKCMQVRGPIIFELQ